MPKRIKIDNEKLLQMVKDGTDQKAIMQHFGYSNSSQLKVAYANALIQAGIAPEIQSTRGSAKSSEVPKDVVVGKRGSIIIPKGLVEELGFSQGDDFSVKKTKTGILLSHKGEE